MDQTERAGYEGGSLFLDMQTGTNADLKQFNKAQNVEPSSSWIPDSDMGMESKNISSCDSTCEP